MATIKLPYGKETLEANILDSRLTAVLSSSLNEHPAQESESQIVRAAMNNPIASPSLRELSKNKEKIVIIASDHTRPVPSKIIIPLMLEEIRCGNPDADITILIATGCHRATSKDELADKFGSDIVSREKIVVHDCEDDDMLIDIGELPSGGRLVINKLAVEADLLCAEGFIEPHFFAGFSGGRKSVLPGIAGRQTVMYNHNSGFIADENSRTGILDNNAIHKDMIYAAGIANLQFIVNVVLDENKNIAYASAGDFNAAHLDGCRFLDNCCRAAAALSDIAITTNGGYPLDQNIYQAVKCMTAAEKTVNKGGVIIAVSKCNDGHGGEGFYNTFRNEKDVDKLIRSFLETAPEDTIPDQWQSQIFARILKHARVILVSDAPDDIVRALHMLPAHSVGEALAIADDLLGYAGTVTVIPDGVSTIVL